MTSLVVIPIVGVVTVCLVLALAWPFLTIAPPSDAADTDDARRQVDDDLERSLQAIREIAFDRATGHLNDEDFTALDDDERARAVELMRRRDRFDEATRGQQ